MQHNEKPFSCRTIGLNCRDCVASSALQLGMVCGEIPKPDVQRIFFRMYEDVACRPMVYEFCDVYQATVAGGSAAGNVTGLEPADPYWAPPRSASGVEPVPA